MPLSAPCHTLSCMAALTSQQSRNSWKTGGTTYCLLHPSQGLAQGWAPGAGLTQAPLRDLHVFSFNSGF